MVYGVGLDSHRKTLPGGEGFDIYHCKRETDTLYDRLLPFTGRADITLCS